jgi:DNA polymerase-3 subunit gamma/tau
MTLLRLLAFEPADRAASTPPVPREPRAVASARAGASGERSPAAARPARDDGNAVLVDRPVLREPAVAVTGSEQAAPAAELRSLPEDASAWPSFVAGLKLAGMAAQLGAQSEWKSLRGNMLTLAIPASHKHLADKTYADKLKVAIERATGRKLLFAFEIGEGVGSLAAIVRRDREQARAESEAAFRSEPFVRDLVTRFGATVRPETIESVANGAHRTSTRQETP